jgi:hypothetical protein
MRYSISRSTPVMRKALCKCGGVCPSCKAGLRGNENVRFGHKSYRVGASNDRYEKEADRVASRVMTSRAGEGPTVSGASRAASGGGVALDASTRAFMEPRFEHDFSHVRIHADGRAAAEARAANARAFTIGRDIVFGAGEYQPRTVAGRRLLAHELTHVVQQASGLSASIAQRQPGEGEGDEKIGCEQHIKDEQSLAWDVANHYRVTKLGLERSSVEKFDCFGQQPTRARAVHFPDGIIIQVTIPASTSERIVAIKDVPKPQGPRCSYDYHCLKNGGGIVLEDEKCKAP